jgi:hypothetical protein
LHHDPDTSPADKLANFGQWRAATYLALEDLSRATATTVEITTSAITSVVKRFICALMGKPRLPQLDFPECLTSGCASFVAAALRFQRKIKSQIISSEYRLLRYEDGEIVPTSHLRFAGRPPRIDRVHIVCSVSFGLAVSEEAGGIGAPRNAYLLRRVEVAIEQDFSDVIGSESMTANRI